MRKSTLTAFSLFILLSGSLASCNSGGSSFNHSLTFKEGETTLGTINGTSGSLISEDSESQSKLTGYETKPNAVFKGWYNNAELSGSPTSIKYFPYVDETFYAYFANRVTITLSREDTSITYPGEETEYSYSGIEGEEIDGTFPTPVKEFSTFTGWAYNGEVYSSKFYPSSSITLVPTFSTWPTLSFVTNVPTYTIDPVKLEPESAVPETLIDASKLDKGENFLFEGWYLEETFQTRFNFESMPKIDTTIYAKFLSKHVVDFITGIDGYTIASVSGFEGDKISAPDPSLLVKPAAYFDGWYEFNQDTNTMASTPYSFTSFEDRDITLKAKWVDNPIVTLYDGSTILAELNGFVPGSYINLNNYLDATSHEHQTMVGWYYLNESSKKVYIIDPEKYVVNNTISLYVEYHQDYLLTINFVDPYGTAILDSSSNPLTYTKIYGSTSIGNPTDELETYLQEKFATTYGSDDYSIIGYKDSTLTNNYTFPASITAEETVACLLAKKVELQFNLETTDYLSLTNSKVVISGYQTQSITDSNIDETGEFYKIYGTTSEISVANYEYAGAYITEAGVDSTNRYVLPSFFPEESIKGDNDHINLVFRPRVII